MRRFGYERVRDTASAIRTAEAGGTYLAGGTTLLDLAKLGVMTLNRLVDLGPLTEEYSAIRSTEAGVTIGAMATMADVEASRLVRARYPMIAEALGLSASTQIRNMARIGGNLLQRTRCPYYRDLRWMQCNRRVPGSGCQAIAGVATGHAVLGGSPSCVALYHGDLAQPLVALDAMLDVIGPGGRRIVPLAGMHRLPGATPHEETTLTPADLIVAVHLPAAAWFERSTYTKLRDRASYEFATASAAVALDLDHGRRVRQARIALGGVATVPWRARDAEARLVGMVIDERSATMAAAAAFASAKPCGDSSYKIELGQRAVVDALMRAAAMEDSA